MAFYRLILSPQNSISHVWPSETEWFISFRGKCQHLVESQSHPGGLHLMPASLKVLMFLESKDFLPCISSLPQGPQGLRQGTVL